MRKQSRKNTLKVLMVNRANSLEVPGGDTVQALKTKEALERQGIEVIFKNTDELSIFDQDIDIAHLFNIQTAEESWEACERIKSNGLKLALSPIYWEDLPLHFWYAMGYKWRLIKKLFGYQIGFRIYANWQKYHYTKQNKWRLQRSLLLASDGILPNAIAEASILIQNFHLPETITKKIQIVPNAIDRSLFEKGLLISDFPLPFDWNNGYLLTVGRISPEKNTLNYLQSMINTSIPMVFVGQFTNLAPEYVAACLNIAKKRGNVYFIEWMSHEKLPSLYANATAHVLPSWRETPGLASLEAAASGCRVVSTSIGSAYEYFGDEAWYCHPANKKSIKRAVTTALNSPVPLNLHTKMVNRFNWDITAQKTLSAYFSILGW